MTDKKQPEALRARSVEPAGEYPALPVPVFESWAQGGLLREAGFTADQMRAYVDADRAMRAAQPDLNLNCKSTQKRLATLWGFVPAQPAPQPLPASQGDALDAARLDWLLLHISGAEFRRIGVHYSGNARRADVDAARKQGANHD